MKILSPSEKCTAANKNLPDFHQATWAWIIVMYDCVVLPEVLSSVLSLSFIYVYMDVYISFSLTFLSSKYINLSFQNMCLSTMKLGLSFLFPTSLFC